MVKHAKPVLHNWQTLKLYITDAYSEDILKAYLQMAGIGPPLKGNLFSAT